MFQIAQNIALYPILGLPLLVWMGVITLSMLFITAGYGYGLMKGKIRGTKKRHQYLAIITLLAGLTHGLLSISIYL